MIYKPVERKKQESTNKGVSGVVVYMYVDGTSNAINRKKTQQNTEKIGWGVEATCTANVFTFEVSEA